MLVAVPAVAEGDGPVSSIEDVNRVVNKVYNWVAGAFWAVAAGFLIWAAMLYATARGNQEQVKKAKNVLIYVVVAIVIGIVATGVKGLIESILS
ncbi:hypothetical protein A2110_02695 [Candidatus Jorgensenbacteria bacterium GWA1_54_12]|uniref:Uncharacterized protein n=1 Tax=Candidatus Jorgensenbacteria bacterium GWA1_54_12 TaxID=1798468 RepID=A0A1F6BL31_9BACT|nr:MAG: hypothetical protein A2110_02695 [Candidatus Jorgensenbacteria bacterium GWA1_54_12]